MDLGIRGRKALLIGASRGLGRACAFAVAAEGVAVTIVARNADALERTAQDIRTATGSPVTAVAGDITTPSGRSAALAACPEPDILLNNADGPQPGDFRQWTRDDWIAALDTMMLSHIEMMRLTVDGAYGPRSEAVCRDFQKAAGLVADGIVGPDTWNAAFAPRPR